MHAPITCCHPSAAAVGSDALELQGKTNSSIIALIIVFPHRKKEKVTNTCSVPDVILRTQLPRMQSDRHGNLSNLMLPVTKSSVLPSKKCGMVTSQKNCFVIIKYDAKYDFKSPRAYLPWRRHSVIMVMSLWMLSPSVCVCLSHTEFSYWMEVSFISSDAHMARL